MWKLFTYILMCAVYTPVFFIFPLFLFRIKMYTGHRVLSCPFRIINRWILHNNSCWWPCIYCSFRNLWYFQVICCHCIKRLVQNRSDWFRLKYGETHWTKTTNAHQLPKIILVFRCLKFDFDWSYWKFGKLKNHNLLEKKAWSERK